MVVFVFHLMFIFLVFSLQDTLKASPTILTTRNSKSLLDILKEKFMSKSNKTNLTKTDKEILRTIKDGLQNRVIYDDNNDGAGSNDWNSESSSEFPSLPSNGRPVLQNGIDEYDVNAKNGRERFVTANKKLDKDIALIDEGNDRNTVNRKNVVHLKKSKAPKKLERGTSEKRNVEISELLDLQLTRFPQVIDALDRPDGVNEAIEIMTMPIVLNKSLVFDVKCPFKKLPDDEALMELVLKKLKYLHWS